MLLFSVALYFFIACFITWLILFPAGRDFVGQSLKNAASRLGRHIGEWENIRQIKTHHIKRAAQESTLHWTGFVKRHSLLLMAGAAVLSLPPLFAWLVSNKNMLDGYDVSTHAVNEQVAELLKGEQLAPPVALPPLLFTTEEVLHVRPMLMSASRNWQLLNNDFAQRLLLAFKIMKEKYGYEMAILEGYRSPERQNTLASMGSAVTNAAAFQSYHQYGLAADCAFLRGGKLVISERDPWAMRGYELYGEVSESVGLHWGGRWKMMDFGHTELRLPGVIKK